MRDLKAIDPLELQRNLDYREDLRRKAIWCLQASIREYQETINARNALGMNIHGLAPVEVLKTCLAALAAIDQCDRDFPIGPAASWGADQLDTVPISSVHDGRFSIVRDEDLPEPWLTRFGAASVLSGRLKEGAYARDWVRFLRLWKEEQAYIEHLKTVVATKWPDAPSDAEITPQKL